MPMNRYPLLAILWLCLLVAQYVLTYLVFTRSRSRIFMVYCATWTHFTTFRAVTSGMKSWKWDWDLFWCGTIAMNCLAFAFVVVYIFDTMRWNVRLPETTHGHASLAFAGIIFAVIATRYWSAGGSATVIRFVEGGCITWICGVAWVGWFLTPGERHMIARYRWLGNGMGVYERLLIGFLIYYSGSVVTVWVWAFVKAPYPVVWGVELAVQAAAVGWWICNL